VPACNRDWSASALTPVHQVYCTGEVLSGVGKQIELAVIYNGALLPLTTPMRIDDSQWYFYLYLFRDPLLGSGNYVCQVRLDGQVVAERPFVIAQ
jgi:hypothetical protein